MVQALAGVILWTDELEAMMLFYRDTLGLTPHSVRPRFVSFKWGDVRLGIGTHSEVTGKAKEPYRVMLNLAVDDIHAEYDRLRGVGVEFIRPPEREHWGGWICTFRDPDGNVLQLLEQPKG